MRLGIVVMLALALAYCTVAVDDVRASSPVLTTVGPPAAAGAGPAAVFSPDGRWLATAEFTDHTVTLFEVLPGGVLTWKDEIDAVKDRTAPAGPFALAFDQDGEILAVANGLLDSVSTFKVSAAGLERLGPPSGQGTGDGPQSLAISPSRRLLATADHNGGGSVSVFQIGADGVLTSSVTSTVPGASGVAFRADGLLAVVSYVPHTVDTYRVEADRSLTRVDREFAPAGTQAVAFDATGTLLATANEGAHSVTVFRVTGEGDLTWRDERSTGGANPFSVAFGPGGLLAVANKLGSSVSVFSVTAHGDISGQSNTTTAATPRSVSFTEGPHGPYLAVATWSNNAVSVFSASPRGRLIPVGLPATTDTNPIGVAFHPGGGFLATANKFGNSVSMIRTPTGAPLQPIPKTTTGANPLAVAFSDDGKFLATANHAEGATGTIRVFPLLQDGVLGSHEDAATGNRPYSVAFQPKGDLLATANQPADGVSVFRIAPDGTPTRIKEREPTGDGPVSVAFSPDGRMLATANQEGAGSVSVFRVLPTDVLELVRREVPTAAAPASVAFSHDGSQLATASATGNSVSVFRVLPDGDLASRRDTQLPSGSAPTAVAFSPTKPLLATANVGGDSMSLYRVGGDGALTRLGDPSPTGESPQSVAFSADGTLIATSNFHDHTVSVFTLNAPALDVWITQTPPDDTNETSASFAFEANYPATFECRLDDNPFIPLCDSPMTYATIAQGLHTFTVRASDPAGNPPVVDSETWRVDLTPPLPPALIGPADGARNLPVSPQFAWAPTTDAQNGIARYELFVDGEPAATVLPAACTTECSATPEAKLTDGRHTWTVRAFDGVGNPITTLPARSFHVDGQGPVAAVLTGPTGNAATAARRPTLSWQAADDRDGIGVKSYEVWLGDARVGTVGAPATTFTPTADLPDGTHRWKVIARDHYENPTPSGVETFVVDTAAPLAVIDGAPNPVREDSSVTFDASRSTDIGSGIARYEWDIIGDRAFERDSGGRPLTPHIFRNPGNYTVQLRVTDRAGNSAVGRLVERVTPHPVEINGGAPYTNSTTVTVEVHWPVSAQRMLVSNSRSFASAKQLRLQRKFRWRLSRGGRDTKTVFVRFIGESTGSRESDSITIDQGKPEVTIAQLATKNGVPVLRLKADDRGPAGVRSVQFTNDRSDPRAGFRDFSDTVELTGRPRERPLKLNKPVYVRVVDRAGNVSQWYTARRAGSSR
jgi:6-phosphogluconolactonase (cycloisomerase 2 family)